MAPKLGSLGSTVMQQLLTAASLIEVSFSIYCSRHVDSIVLLACLHDL